MRIAQASAQIGVEPHVLRHWDDVGVLRPSRTATGHRDYDAEAVARGRTIRACQNAGMVLADIRVLFDFGATGRRRLIERHRASVSQQIERLQSIHRYLDHALECSHPMVSQCPECATFATTSSIPPR